MTNNKYRLKTTNRRQETWYSVEKFDQDEALRQAKLTRKEFPNFVSCVVVANTPEIDEMVEQQ